MKLPSYSSTVQSMIDAHEEERQEEPRTHLGASLIGHKCERLIWLTFRWAVREKLPGRMLRLFQRGHDEEKKMVHWLQNIGCVFRENVSRIDFDGHVSGTPDGIIESGVPTAEKTPHLFECKTANEKSFNDLEKKGVKLSKPQHYMQMQVYMLGANLDRALYAVTCKNDDRLYFERVKLDKMWANAMIAKGQQIAVSQTMPPPLSASPTWYECKMCAAYAFCHQGVAVTERNCRTCASSRPDARGQWYCIGEKDKELMTAKEQVDGCSYHRMRKDLEHFHA